MELDLADFAGCLVSSMADAIVYADAEGVIRVWNRGATRIFGFAEAEALGRSLDLIVPENLRERHWQVSRHDAHRAIALRKRPDPVCAGCAEGRHKGLCRVHHRAVHRQCRPDDRHCRNHARRYSAV
jgi:PAS domain-containing protein